MTSRILTRAAWLLLIALLTIPAAACNETGGVGVTVGHPGGWGGSWGGGTYPGVPVYR